LGENIADQGGERLAFQAWQNSRKNSTTENPDLKSDNNAQTFFLGFAQMWCAKGTPEYFRHLARTNPHSAPKYRVIGVVSDDPNFAKAFSCKTGDKMVRQNQCEVW
jgi:predicted metalloendopeptidase